MRQIRQAIISHPGLQALLFVALLCLYIWTLERPASQAVRIVADLCLLAIPIGSNLLHRDRVRDLGLRIDNLRASALAAGAVTLFCSLVIVLVNRAYGWPLAWNAGAGLMVLGYLPWSFAQQYMLQSFVYRRMREAMPGSQQASIASALLFAVVHFPNPLLLATTASAGYLWCRAFGRAPNLFMLAVSHAWLVTLLMTSVPKEVHRFLRIGPRYWEWSG